MRVRHRFSLSLGLAMVILGGCATATSPTAAESLQDDSTALLQPTSDEGQAATSGEDIKGIALPEPVEVLENGMYLHQTRRLDDSTAYVFSNRPRLDEESAQPVVILVTGSGCRSVMRKLDDGTVSMGLVGHFYRTLPEGYTLLVPERRGVVPLVSMGRDSEDGCSEAFDQGATMERRVEELQELVIGLREWPAVDPERIVMVGHSEGADVVAVASAALKPLVTHVGYLAGGGPTQMLDFLYMIRHQGEAAGLDSEAIEAQVGQMAQLFTQVLQQPDNTSDILFGNPVSRWASFLSYAAVEHLLQLDAPIFVAHGLADTSVPVMAADFIQVEFIRHRKDNLTIRRYPGLDHSFQLCATVACTERESKFDDVAKDFFQWVEAN